MVSSSSLAFHNRNLVQREAVEFVHQLVNLPVGRVNLTLVQLPVGLRRGGGETFGELRRSVIFSLGARVWPVRSIGRTTASQYVQRLSFRDDCARQGEEKDAPLTWHAVTLYPDLPAELFYNAPHDG